jgi:hypothetical protein
MKNFEIKNSKLGLGLFTTRDITKDELIINWNDGSGEIYELTSVFDLPKIAANHAIQFGEHEWIDHPEGRFINHSCTPNCGWGGKFQLVAMRNIKNGEELFLDYDTMEDSEWVMPDECACGTKRCRKTIRGFRFLPKEMIVEYMDGGYISPWLVEKYNLATKQK